MTKSKMNAWAPSAFRRKKMRTEKEDSFWRMQRREGCRTRRRTKMSQKPRKSDLLKDFCGILLFTK